MEVGVKKVIHSFISFISETKLSSHVTVSVDWDEVAKDLPDMDEFNKQLSILSNDLKSLTSKNDDETQLENLSQSSAELQPGSSGHEDTVIKKEVMPDVTLDPMFVQISASNSEIDRRIQAFIEKKQIEVDDTNVREFSTSHSTSNQEESSTCARTDAQFKCRSGTRSHVKVSKVVNLQGPQTRPAMIHHLTSLIQSPSKRSRPEAKSPLASSSHHGGTEERLRNMELHLKVKRGHGSPDIFERLKNLENRILHLESVSPEYLDVVNSLHKRRRLDMGNPGLLPGNEFSIKEIDHRIQQLQESLLKKRVDSTQDPGSMLSW